MRKFGFNGRIPGNYSYYAVTRSYYSHNVFFYKVSQVAIIGFFGIDATLAACSGGGSAVIQLALKKMAQEALNEKLADLKEEIITKAVGKMLSIAKDGLIEKVALLVPEIAPFVDGINRVLPDKPEAYGNIDTFTEAFGENLVICFQDELSKYLIRKMANYASDLSGLEDSFGLIIDNYNTNVVK